MKAAGKPNSLLIEMIIVLFFFSISVVVILQLFMAAHDASVQSNVGNAATMMLEDLSARFSASGETAEGFFENEGWTQTDEGFVQTQVVGGRTLHVMAQGEQIVAGAGLLDDFLVTVRDGEREVVQMPIARYTPGEDGL